MGIGNWGLGIGDWGLGPIPNPQSPIPNPQSPCQNFHDSNKKKIYKLLIFIYKFKHFFNGGKNSINIIKISSFNRIFS